MDQLWHVSTLIEYSLQHGQLYQSNKEHQLVIFCNMNNRTNQIIMKIVHFFYYIVVCICDNHTKLLKLLHDWILWYGTICTV